MSNAENADGQTSIAARDVFTVIREAGEEELARPFTSLFWSGIAAGILISFSVLTEAYLRASLPDTEWRFAIENFGYSMGFLLVILGRMQLFTENTITTVIPAIYERSLKCTVQMLKLWGIVLFANVIGAFVAAAFMAFSSGLSAEVVGIVNDLSKHATGYGFSESLVRGIPAGILIAAIVWMIPSAPSAQVLIVILFTWLIAMGDFTHVVAGSVEMAFLILTGQMGIIEGFTVFFVPTFLGNVIGGTVIFTLLAWAQVKLEVEKD
ncbi:formate/nitrite transporter family protein [Pseudaestuariivita rosea]|uniref:formate/nitrite transporter family protein n=1 Tax=Pseudaestuariivita rosea TaxID=2763263 RepID=UPI001ABB3BBC|nr:formate/nitrite transporter family protein [Pseudaestuariivita rosea]